MRLESEMLEVVQAGGEGDPGQLPAELLFTS